jgi:hypothetical protein
MGGDDFVSFDNNASRVRRSGASWMRWVAKGSKRWTRIPVPAGRLWICRALTTGKRVTTLAPAGSLVGPVAKSADPDSHPRGLGQVVATCRAGLLQLKIRLKSMKDWLVCMRIPGSHARCALRLLAAPARSAHARVDGNAAAARRRVTLMRTRDVTAIRRNQAPSCAKGGRGLRVPGRPLNIAGGRSDA